MNKKKGERKQGRDGETVQGGGREKMPKEEIEKEIQGRKRVKKGE